MPNVIIKPWDQSAPEFKYDPVLAREAAEFKNSKTAGSEDWDAIDWEAANPQLAARRRMKNQNFDAELDTPGHHDPRFRLLEMRSYIERIERRPAEWVDENIKLFESNCRQARKQHMPGQERFEGADNERRRLVNIMHPSRIMAKLRAAGVDARDEEHPQARIWLNDWTKHGLVGVNAWMAPEPMEEEAYLLMLRDAKSNAQRDIITENFWACRAGRKVRRTLTCLQEPYGPEWSLMHFNDHGVATKEKYRGWRTALLVLIIADILTEAEVDTAFGPPIGEAATWYRMQLKTYRDLKARV